LINMFCCILTLGVQTISDSNGTYRYDASGVYMLLFWGAFGLSVKFYTNPQNDQVLISDTIFPER